MKQKFTFFALLKLVLCTGAFCSSPNWHLDGSNDGWKDECLAIKYFHHSELQRQWAWHLLGRHPLKGNERILDFGCGDGKITAEVSHFVPNGRIHGVDLSPSMIAFATRCFPSAYYPNLTFAETLDAGFNDPIAEGKVDLIYSLCVFHLVPNPIQVLTNLHKRLSPNGKLLLIIPSGNNPAFFQAANEIFAKYGMTAPWSKDRKGSAQTMRTVEGCSECLKAAGFEPLSIVQLHTPTAFYNKQGLLDWMVGTTTANWQIPFEKAEIFFSEVIDRMAELDSDVISPSGAYMMKLSRIEVVAKRAD